MMLITFSVVLSAGWPFVLYREDIIKTISEAARISASGFTANSELSRE